MRGGAALVAATLALTACGGHDEPPLDNRQVAQIIENIAEEPEEPVVKGPAAPALAELSAEDLARELRPGAGCDFAQRGRLLFAVAAGYALAKVNGVPLHLAASGPMGPTGGFFVSDRFSISVGRLVEAGATPDATADDTRTWPARLTLTDRRAEANGETRLDGVWRCGA